MRCASVARTARATPLAITNSSHPAPRLSLRSASRRLASPRADRADHSVRRKQGKQAGRADRLIASPRQLECGTYIYYIIAMLAPYARCQWAARSAIGTSMGAMIVCALCRVRGVGGGMAF